MTCMQEGLRGLPSPLVSSEVQKRCSAERSFVSQRRMRLKASLHGGVGEQGLGWWGKLEWRGDPPIPFPCLMPGALQVRVAAAGSSLLRTDHSRVRSRCEADAQQRLEQSLEQVLTQHLVIQLLQHPSHALGARDGGGSRLDGARCVGGGPGRCCVLGVA